MTSSRKDRINVSSAFLLILLAGVSSATSGCCTCNCACPCQGPPSLTRPRDCKDILESGHQESGVYRVYPEEGGSFTVYCDMETDGGGWTVFQRRQDGSLDFYRKWTSYKAGFGQEEGEHWLGNDFLHQLTSQGQYELRIDLEDWTGATRYAVYGIFSVNDERHKYRLTLGRYSGTAGDSMVWRNLRAGTGTLASLNGAAFSTYDQDNDTWSQNCAMNRHGAWWYLECTHSNLNGRYRQGGTYNSRENVEWVQWKGNQYSLKKTEMKIRPINRNLPSV